MSKVISSVTGTRTEPMDSLTFVKGTVARFKIILQSDGVPVTVDISTTARAKIFAPASISVVGQVLPQLLATIDGTLVTGQEFEYEFVWNVPASQTPLDNYIISYEGTIASMFLNFGDEYFTISGSAGPVTIKVPTYATISDVRLTKSNIDDYVPKALRKDLNSRNDYIQAHLERGTDKLREELSLAKARGNSANYRLFVSYYAVWSILLSARGEDGSSVSDQNIIFWRAEWEDILSQEKRESVFQGLPLGRG